MPRSHARVHDVPRGCRRDPFSQAWSLAQGHAMKLESCRMGMLAPRVVTVLVILAAWACANAAINDSTPDYSERLDGLWDFDHPDVSQRRFLEEAKRHSRQSRGV